MQNLVGMGGGQIRCIVGNVELAYHDVGIMVIFSLFLTFKIRLGRHIC